jgi:hypothetical protein
MFSVCYVFTSHCLVTDPNNVDATAPMLTSLPAGDCLAANSWWLALHSWLSVESELTLRLAVYRQSVRKGAKPLEVHDKSFFLQMNPCGHSLYVSSSLTRGWVCRLQLLLALASAVILRSESRETHDHILVSRIRDSSNLEARSPYLYPPGIGWPGYNPRHLIPFSSPPATRRAAVEVFDLASARDV